MPTTRRSRRLTRMLATAAIAAGLLVTATGGSQAETATPVSASAPPGFSDAGAARTASTATPVPKLDVKRNQLPDGLQALADDERWYEAGGESGYNMNCLFPNSEVLGRSWVGWFGSIGKTPTTDQPRYYTKIGWGVSGNPCGGGAYVHVEEFLPPGSQLAITQGHPVMCWYEGIDADDDMRRFGPGEGCPQQPQNGLQGGLSFDPSDGSGAWPTATGAYFEIWVPIKTTQPLNGLLGNPCKSCLQAGVWMIDGQSSPWSFPRIGVQVVGSAPSTPYVSYPAPSIRKTSCCSGPVGQEALGEIVAWIFTQGNPGTTEFQVSPQPGGPYETIATGTITTNDIGALGKNIEQFLPINFPPDVQFYWRLCYDPSGLTRTCGVEQTFSVPSPHDATPPETTIVEKPAQVSGSRVAAFAFRSSALGSTFQCNLDDLGWELCLTPSYEVADGSHTLQVRAVNKSNVADPSPESYTWTVSAPPETEVTAGPPAKTRKTSATFEFVADEATKAFKCKLDTGKWKRCSTGTITYSKLNRTKHTFSVKAIDTTGKVDPTPAKRSWTITR